MSMFSLLFLLIFATYFIKNSICTYQINKTTEITDDMLKDYLIEFGYLPPIKNTRNSNSTDESNEMHEVLDLRYHIRKLQRFFGLKITGIFDESTKKLISKPRCGVPDMLDSTTLKGRNRKWSKDTLTYSILTFTNDLEKSLVRKVIREAFDLWSEVVPLDFIELPEVNSTADIKIGFTTGEHGCSKAFSGPGGVLAHANFPPDGKIHFDDAEHWVYMDANKIESFTDDSGEVNYVDLLNIAAHEIGHAIGIDHANNEDSIMSAMYKPTLDNDGNYMKPKLTPYDVTTARKLYGARKESFKANTNDNELLNELNHLKMVHEKLLRSFSQLEMININLTVKYKQLKDEYTLRSNNTPCILVTKEKELDKKEEDLSKKEKEMGKKKEELVKKQEQLDIKEELLNKKEEEFVKKHEQLGKKEEQLNKKEEELRNKEGYLGNKEKVLGWKVEELDKKKEELRKKEEELRKKEEKSEPKFTEDYLRASIEWKGIAEDKLSDIVKWVTEIKQNNKSELICNEMKKKLENKFGIYWHCFFGKINSLGIYYTYTDSYVQFKFKEMDDKKLLIYRTERYTFTRFNQTQIRNSIVKHHTNMDQYKQDKAVKWLEEALTKYTDASGKERNGKEICTFMQKNFQSEYNYNWICIFGKDFTYSMYSQERIWFYIYKQFDILIFRQGNS